MNFGGRAVVFLGCAWIDVSLNLRDIGLAILKRIQTFDLGQKLVCELLRARCLHNNLKVFAVGIELAAVLRSVAIKTCSGADLGLFSNAVLGLEHLPACGCGHGHYAYAKECRDQECAFHFLSSVRSGLRYVPCNFSDFTSLFDSSDQALC